MCSHSSFSCLTPLKILFLYLLSSISFPMKSSGLFVILHNSWSTFLFLFKKCFSNKWCFNNITFSYCVLCSYSPYYPIVPTSRSPSSSSTSLIALLLWYVLSSWWILKFSIWRFQFHLGMFIGIFLVSIMIWMLMEFLQFASYISFENIDPQLFIVLPSVYSSYPFSQPS